MITVVVGKEIEKIKGDFESYLNGLNMVGEISYSQYSELYDEGVKQIQRAYELGKSEIEKENAELKEALKNDKVCKCSHYLNFKDLEKENGELVQNKYNLEYKIENLENKIEHHQEVIDVFKKENAEAKDIIENLITKIPASLVAHFESEKERAEKFLGWE